MASCKSLHARVLLAWELTLPMFVGCITPARHLISNRTFKKPDAGRDGMPARCILYVEDKDFETLKMRAIKSFPSENDVRQAYQTLANLSFAAIGEKPDEPVSIPNPELHPSLALLSQAGYIEIERQRAKNEGIVRWLGNDIPDALDSVHLELANWCLRHGRNQEVAVNLADVAKKVEGLSGQFMDVNVVKQSLTTLDAKGLIDWVEFPENWLVTWIQPRIETKNVVVNRDRLELVQHQIQCVHDFAFAPIDICRAEKLEAYLGDHSKAVCQVCDHCSASQSTWTSELSSRLDAGDVEVTSLLLHTQPVIVLQVRKLLGDWYRSGIIDSSMNRVRWSKRSIKE